MKSQRSQPATAAQKSPLEKGAFSVQWTLNEGCAFIACGKTLIELGHAIQDLTLRPIHQPALALSLLMFFFVLLSFCSCSPGKQNYQPLGVDVIMCPHPGVPADSLTAVSLLDTTGANSPLSRGVATQWTGCVTKEAQ